MGGRIDSATWDQRRAWIEKQATSGFSAARFCRENELKLSNFNAWKRKLGGVGAATRPKRGEQSGKAITLLSNAFTQVPFQVTSRVASSAQWIEISLADGMVVRVPAANLPALKLVLGALGASQEPTHA